MVCTNNTITLYDIKIGKQKSKSVKQIPIQNQSESIVAAYFEPMANTLVLVDSRAQVNVLFLNLHDVKTKVGNKFTKQFNLEIALFDPSQSGEVENPYAKATLTQKMSSFFKNISTGKFFIKDNLPNKNLRLQVRDFSEEGKRKSREEH